MSSEKLMNLFTVCIWVGLAIPLLSLLLGGMSSLLDFDFNFDGGGLDAPFPITPTTLSFTAVVFGALGRALLAPLGPLWGTVLAAIVGIAGGLLIARFVVRPLRRNRADALRIEDLRWQEGRVKLEVRQDFVGTVTVHSSIGSMVSYNAKPLDGVACIPVGTRVMVVEVDAVKRLLIVSPMDNPTHPKL